MNKIKVLSANHMFWLLIVLIDISTTSYAGELKNHINDKYDAGGIKLHIECYGDKSPSIIVQSGFNGYGSEDERGAVIEKMSQKKDLYLRSCAYGKKR